MALVRTENTYPELLLGDNLWRDEVFLAAAALTFPVGLILGRIAVGGKMDFYDVAETNGTQLPSAVLTVELVTTGIGDFAFRPMISGGIREDQLLVWTGGSPVAPTLAVVDQLRSYGIIGQLDRELLAFDN